MSPIRRRTFFGPLSIQGLRNFINEMSSSDDRIKRLDYLGQEISVELMEKNAKDREMRLAAEKVLEKRLEREAEGRAKLEKNKGRRL
jgi:ribosomal protein S1